jgi:uncharacterized small protein (DUF1192 family)
MAKTRVAPAAPPKSRIEALEARVMMLESEITRLLAELALNKGGTK